MTLQHSGGGGRDRVQDFGNGCFAYLLGNEWGQTNSGLITDSGEALLVDTLFDDAHTRRMLDRFREVSRSRIRTLVNTHQHGDHCFSNGVVEGAEIIATTAAAEAMRQDSPETMARLIRAAPNLGTTGEFLLYCFGDYDFDHCTPRCPDTSFSTTLRRQVGSKAVELMAVGPAHSSGDALVHVPDDRTVFAGDIVVVNQHPFLWGSSSENWIDACDKILALDVETVVPGHGPPTNKIGVGRVARYIAHIRKEAEARFVAGLDPLEAARSIALDDYDGWGGSERIAANVASLYVEFGRTDVALDVETLFGWMAQLWRDRK